MENTSQPVEEISKTGENIFTMVAHSVIFLVGVPGNCLILLVYWTKSHKTSTHVLIMALACADISVCLLRVRRISVEALILAGEEIPRSLHIIWAFMTTSAAMSILVTAAIAADRYDCVCRSRNRFFTTRRAKRTVWASLLFSLVINIPAFIAMSTDPSNTVMRMLLLAFQVFCFVTALAMIVPCYGLVYMTIRKHVKVGTLFNARQDANSVTDRDGCQSVVRPDVSQPISVVPMTSCISHSNARSTTKIRDIFSVPLPNLGSTREGNAERVSTKETDMATREVSPAERDVRMSGDGSHRPDRELTDNDRALAKEVRAVRLQRKTTRMLFITSVVFLLTWLPYWTSISLEFAVYGGARISPTLLSIIRTSSATLFTNNAVNPLIYGLANRRFRKDCREVLRKIKLC